VPYGKEVKLMVQYQGFLALLWRSKSIKSVAARVVFKGDEFEIQTGMTTFIKHVPKFVREQEKDADGKLLFEKGKPVYLPAEPILYWAGVVPANGEFMCEIMSLEDVKDHARQYAKGLDKADSPWITAFDEMAKKTVLRRLMKLLAFSPESEMANAIKIDEELYEQQTKAERVERVLELSAQPSEMPEELEIAKNRLQACLDEAEAMNVDVSKFTAMLKKEDYASAKKVSALADTIGDHLDGIQAGNAKPVTK